MSVEEIEKAITQLPAAERAKLRAWWDSQDAAEFDAKIERDAQSGKLDKLFAESQADFRTGNAREI